MAPLSAPGRYFNLTLFLVGYFQGLFRDSLLGPSLMKSPWPGCFHLYSGWSLWLIPQPLIIHPLASCSWSYFTPQGREPTSRQWEIHLWLRKALSAGQSFSCLHHQSIPSPSLSHFLGSALNFQGLHLSGSHAKHSGFEGSKNGATDLGRSPLIFCISQCILSPFVWKEIIFVPFGFDKVFLRQWKCYHPKLEFGG